LKGGIFLNKEGKRVTAHITDLHRLQSYERALDASRLIRTKKFYEETERLARSVDPENEKGQFIEFSDLCKEAGIDDPKLVLHMWTIIKACAYEKGRNYLAENPGPLW
jgi:hypothetical protein